MPEPVRGPRPGLALIIPLLNEAAALPALLAHIDELDVDEIIIVDGGSQDGSWRAVLDAAASHSSLTPLASAPGRARQMNAGAALARADTLLFLHADTRLPARACRKVRSAVESGAAWGRFDISLDSRRRVLRLVAWMMNRRSALTGICTGDQAMFVRRELFNSLGGYADIPLMEDIDLSRRLRKVRAPYRIAARATTSARRWENNGPLRTMLSMWRNRLLYWLGSDPARLARRYPDVR